MISVILPTYNRSKYIARAIQSVLNQTFRDFELIVVNDGSTDNTEDIVKQFQQKDPRIVYIKNEKNVLIVKSLNQGLMHSKGEYIARIDDDDEWIDTDKLKKQIEYLEKNKKCVLVGTGVVMIDENGREILRAIPPETDDDIRKLILFKNCFTHASVVFKKNIVVAQGGYDEKSEMEDYELWLQIGTVGEFYIFPSYSVRIQRHPNSMTERNRGLFLVKEMNLLRQFKKHYPNYFQALLFHYAKYFLYGILGLPPINIIRSNINNFYSKRQRFIKDFSE